MIIARVGSWTVRYEGVPGLAVPAYSVRDAAGREVEAVDDLGAAVRYASLAQGLPDPGRRP